MRTRDPLNGWSPAVHYFGEPWPSDVCEKGARAFAPIGQSCWLCHEVILEGDQGTWLVKTYPGYPLRTGQKPVHRECLLRQLAGSVAHLEGRCPCFGGTDGPVGTYRQEAMRVWAWLDARHFQVPNPVARRH